MSWSTTIKSPNYPNAYSNSGSQTWLISAPIPESTIDIEFDENLVCCMYLGIRLNHNKRLFMISINHLNDFTM